MVLPGEEPEERRLPGAVGAHEPQARAPGNQPGEGVEEELRAEAPLHTVELDHRKPGIIFAAMPRLPLVVLACALAGSLTHAASWDASFSAAEGMPGTFELPFPVLFPGKIVVEATWTGPRPVFFGVENGGKDLGGAALGTFAAGARDRRPGKRGGRRASSGS
jgi:hypothetical protein